MCTLKIEKLCNDCKIEYQSNVKSICIELFAPIENYFWWYGVESTSVASST